MSNARSDLVIVGKRRIRHGTTLNLNDVIFNRFGVDLEIHHSISESFYIGYDIDFKIKWPESGLPLMKCQSGEMVRTGLNRTYIEDNANETYCCNKN